MVHPAVLLRIIHRPRRQPMADVSFPGGDHMRVRSIPGVFSVLLLLAAAGCGHVPFGKADRNHSSATLVQTSAQDSVTLPDGYGPITTLAGDPSGSGVWFWADTQTTLSIFHVDGQGKLTSWPVLTG